MSSSDREGSFLTKTNLMTSPYLSLKTLMSAHSNTPNQRDMTFLSSQEKTLKPEMMIMFFLRSLGAHETIRSDCLFLSPKAAGNHPRQQDHAKLPAMQRRTLFKLRLVSAGVLAVARSAAGWVLQTGQYQYYRLSTAGRCVFSCADRSAMWCLTERRQRSA